MQISARSCLAAGISLTTATAIAITPIAATANDRTVTVRSVTVSDIQLTVTPGEVREFFRNLQTQLTEINATVAEAAKIPGQTVVEALHSAIALNDQFYDTLISSTDNLTLQALFQTLQLSGDNGLGSLAAAVSEANNAIVFSGRDLADILGAIVTGGLANVVAAVVRVANDPLSFYNWARVPEAFVASTTLVAGDLTQGVRTVGNLGLDLTFTGIDLVQTQINNAINSVRGLINVGAQATGSPLIQAVVAATQAVTIAPLQLGIILPLALSSEVLSGVKDGFNTALDGLAGTRGPDGEYVPGIIVTAGRALSLAIDAIGEDPLNVLSYTGAAGLLAKGGFDVFDKGVETTAAVARVPFEVGINMLDPDEFAPSLTNVIIRYNNQLAAAIAGVLEAVGLPENIVDLPLAFADQVNGVIRAGAGAAVGGLNAAIDVIDTGATFVVDVSNEIENVILGTGSEAEPEPTAPDPSPDAAVTLVDDTSEVDAPAKEIAAESISEEDGAEDEGAGEDDAPPTDEAQDDALSDDESAGDAESETTGSYTSSNGERRAEREAKKAEKAAEQDSTSDTAGDTGSEDEPAGSAAA